MLNNNARVLVLLNTLPLLEAVTHLHETKHSALMFHRVSNPENITNQLSKGHLSPPFEPPTQQQKPSKGSTVDKIHVGTQNSWLLQQLKVGAGEVAPQPSSKYNNQLSTTANKPRTTVRKNPGIITMCAPPHHVLRISAFSVPLWWLRALQQQTRGAISVGHSDCSCASQQVLQGASTLGSGPQN